MNFRHTAAQIANIAAQNSNIAAQIARHTATQVTARRQPFHLQLVEYIQGITIDLQVKLFHIYILVKPEPIKGFRNF